MHKPPVIRTKYILGKIVRKIPSEINIKKPDLLIDLLDILCKYLPSYPTEDVYNLIMNLSSTDLILRGLYSNAIVFILRLTDSFDKRLDKSLQINSPHRLLTVPILQVETHPDIICLLGEELYFSEPDIIRALNKFKRMYFSSETGIVIRSLNYVIERINSSLTQQYNRISLVNVYSDTIHLTKYMPEISETEISAITIPNPQSAIVNKGTGAGGANTNYYGKLFEEKTNNQQRLFEMGYTKTNFTQNSKKTTKTSQKVYDYYLSKTYEDKTIVFVLQNGLKKYIKHKYNADLFRCPDEAYIIEYTSGRKVIKILEKKEQNVEGSVETKLWSGPSLKREYELMLGPDFEVFYGFCVSGFLKNKLISTDKKYTILNTIFTENNIAVLFGDDENYFETFDAWVNNSL